MQSNRLHEKIADGLNELLETATVIIDSQHNILNAQGELGKFIKLPIKGFSNNLMEVVPKGVGAILRHLIRKCENQHKKQTYLDVPLEIDNPGFKVDLFVKEFANPDEADALGFMVVFKPQQNLIPKTAYPVVNQEKIESILESELEYTRKKLESLNEDVKALKKQLHSANEELQEKEGTISTLSADLDHLVNIPDIGSLFLDKELKIRKFTPNIKKHFNLLETDINRPISDFSHNLKHQEEGRLLEVVQMVMESEKPNETEVKGNQGQWYVQRIIPYLKNKKLDGVIINYINIHHLKENQIALQEKKEEFQSLFENAPDMFLQVDNNGVILNVNQELVSQMEYDNKGEIIGRPLEEIIPVEKNLNNEKIPLVCSDKTITKSLRTVTSKKGNTLPIRVNAKGVFDEKNELKYLLASCCNVGDVINIEKELKDKNIALEQVLEGTMAGFWDWDIRTNVEYMSPTFKKMFGYEDHEMENTPEAWQRIIHPEDLPIIFEVFDIHIKTRGEVPFDNEARYYHKNGSIVWVWCRGKVIEWDEDGNPLRMVGSHVDITPLKNYQTRLKESNEELERFAYVASHDLQEPLKTIQSFMEILKLEYENVLEGDGITYIDFIVQATDRMKSLIDGVLNFSKIGERELNQQEVGLGSVVTNVLEDMKDKIQRNHVRVVVDELPSVRGFTTELYSLFQNLISNAIKFAKPTVPPEIHIYSTPSQLGAHISVADNGIGIPEKHLKDIFDLFRRLHSDQEISGTGIGLSNCKKIVKLHEGDIWIESEEGRGSIFHFTLNKKKPS